MPQTHDTHRARWADSCGGDDAALAAYDQAAAAWAEDVTAPAVVAAVVAARDGAARRLARMTGWAEEDDARRAFEAWSEAVDAVLAAQEEETR